MVTEAQVLDALRKIQDPDLGRDIVSLDFVKNLNIEGGNVSFTIELTTPACPVKEMFKTQATEHVSAIEGVESVTVEMTAKVAASNPFDAQKAIPGIKNIVAVSSGKGGVGKSTVAVNLACALAQTGASVGIMDADVHGPNIPLMLGASGNPEIVDQKIQPKTAHGLKLMSIALLVDEDKPVIWRGPMLHSAIKQFLTDVAWGELDYLVVDLPPGTGDAQLSLAQQAHLMGAVIVTTPQDVSVLDVKKAVNMFTQVKVPVLGVVENMAGLSVSGSVSCAGEGSTVTIAGPDGPQEAKTDAQGKFECVLDVFGSGGGDLIAEKFGLPVLGRIPLDPAVRKGGDSGLPVTIGQPESMIADRFAQIAGQLAMQVSKANLSS